MRPFLPSPHKIALFHLLSPHITRAYVAAVAPRATRPRKQHRDAESLDMRKETADALAARYPASCPCSCNDIFFALFYKCCLDRFLDA